MGRVRTNTVKKSSRQVVEQYYSRMTLDFHANKKVPGEVAAVPTKGLRKKIAGFSTQLLKRIPKGPVRGLSLKLHEDDRNLRLELVPAVRTDRMQVDRDTLDMLSVLGMSDIPGLVRPPVGLGSRRY